MGLTKPQRSTKEIIEALYFLQEKFFDDERWRDPKWDDPEIPLCEGSSEEDLKWRLKTEEDLSEKLESLVERKRLHKYPGFLDDDGTVFDKYIPIELHGATDDEFYSLLSSLKYSEAS